MASVLHQAHSQTTSACPDFDLGKVNAGQAPGTHWYHAHKHGSTSLHIRNGLAGVFVIESNKEGGYDHFLRRSLGWGPEYRDHEKILIFQQYDPTQNLERPQRTAGTGSRQVLVNGKLAPTITMRPGEIQLWRMVNGTQGSTTGMINAGNFKTGLFTAAKFGVVQTAQDGVQFSQMNYANQPYLNGKIPNGVLPNGEVANGLILGAGNRADILVQAPLTTGTYPFITVSGNPGFECDTVLRGRSRRCCFSRPVFPDVMDGDAEVSLGLTQTWSFRY